VLVIVIASAVVLNRFDKCRIGKTIKAVSTNDTLSESIGINAWGYKAAAFVIASFFAGIAGVVFANYNGFVAPTDYTAVFMFKIIASAIIGGTRTFAGPIVGLLFLTILQEIFRDVYQIVPLIWGLCIIGILLFLPHGIESQFKWVQSLPERMMSKLKKRQEKLNLETGRR
jgi:branched-chain amino acid transport system permease protein